MTSSEPKPPRPRNVVLYTLTETFKAFRDCLPLAIGIHKAIMERLPDIGRQELRTALRIHTASTRYLKVLSRAEFRFDLDGSPAGEVMAEQRQQALKTIRERFHKQAERKKEEQLATQQQEKLNELVERFSSR